MPPASRLRKPYPWLALPLLADGVDICSDGTFLVSNRLEELCIGKFLVLLPFVGEEI